ncbi:MAG: hypothetical protein KJZ73_03175 [Pseudorhodoplanes sp.]|nr:hypothetical protein [Pseudorhodoplanes sp.]
MLPDLRLLIPATVATFFLAAAVGLYASLRLVQDPFATDARTADESPINRIVTGWPMPESNRAAALRELAVLLKDGTPVALPVSLAPARNEQDQATATPAPADTPAPAETGIAPTPANGSVHAKDAANPVQITALPVTPDETLKTEPIAQPMTVEIVPEAGSVAKSAAPHAQRPARTVRRRPQPVAQPTEEALVTTARSDTPGN